jgi:hypothetical protein
MTHNIYFYLLGLYLLQNRGKLTPKMLNHLYSVIGDIWHKMNYDEVSVFRNLDVYDDFWRRLAWRLRRAYE